MIPIPERQYAILKAELASRVASGGLYLNDFSVKKACECASKILNECGLEPVPEHHSASDGVRSMMFKTMNLDVQGTEGCKVTTSTLKPT